MKSGTLWHSDRETSIREPGTFNICLRTLSFTVCLCARLFALEQRRHDISEGKNPRVYSVLMQKRSKRASSQLPAESIYLSAGVFF